MDETQRLCVQSLPRTKFETVVDKGLIGRASLPAENLRTAISLVAKERMADASHVSADLMRASGLENTLQKGDLSKAFYHAIMGYSRLPDA